MTLIKTNRAVSLFASLCLLLGISSPASGDDTTAWNDPNPGQLSYLGNVGIGTANPDAQLQVIGYSLFGFSKKGIRLRTDGLFVDIESLGQPLAINYQNNRNTVMNVVSGNVGIGTNNPQSKLEVAGSLVVGSNAKGVRTRTNGLFVDIESMGTDLAINFQTGRDTVMNVIGGKVGISLCHLNRTVPKKFFNPIEIDTSHH